MVRVCTHELQFLPIQVPSGPRAAAALHGLGGQRPRSLPASAPVGRSGGAAQGGRVPRSQNLPEPGCAVQGAAGAGRRRTAGRKRLPGAGAEGVCACLDAPWLRMSEDRFCSVRQTHRQLRSRRRGEVGCNLAGGGLFPGLRPAPQRTQAPGLPPAFLPRAPLAEPCALGPSLRSPSPGSGRGTTRTHRRACCG